MSGLLGMKRKTEVKAKQSLFPIVKGRAKEKYGKLIPIVMNKNDGRTAFIHFYFAFLLAGTLFPLKYLLYLRKKIFFERNFHLHFIFFFIILYFKSENSLIAILLLFFRGKKI